MTFKMESRLRPAEVIEKYGGCLELAPIDKHFHDISVGLYVKDGVSTVWSYSRREGVEERLRAIRDQMVVLGGMAAVEGVPNQLRFDCGELHPRTLRFLIAQAVGKAPDYAPPGGAMSIRDSKSALTIHVEDAETRRETCIASRWRGRPTMQHCGLEWCWRDLSGTGKWNKLGTRECPSPAVGNTTP